MHNLRTLDRVVHRDGREGFIADARPWAYADLPKEYAIAVDFDGDELPTVVDARDLTRKTMNDKGN